MAWIWNSGQTAAFIPRVLIVWSEWVWGGGSQLRWGSICHVGSHERQPVGTKQKQQWCKHIIDSHSPLSDTYILLILPYPLCLVSTRTPRALSPLPIRLRRIVTTLDNQILRPIIMLIGMLLAVGGWRGRLGGYTLLRPPPALVLFLLPFFFLLRVNRNAALRSRLVFQLLQSSTPSHILRAFSINTLPPPIFQNPS